MHAGAVRTLHAQFTTMATLLEHAYFLTKWRTIGNQL